MSLYILKCSKNAGNINPRVSKIGNVKTMLLSKYAICSNKKSLLKIFIKDFIEVFIKKIY